jgi:hypothetical protein
MGTKHKQYDYIVAWAAGEEIEYLEEGGWYPLPPLVPPYYEDCRYRIKPKIVKREGWVNVYGYGYSYNSVWNSRKEADIRNDENSTKRIACVRIEWEEEE